jgi:hypothetical protein
MTAISFDLWEPSREKTLGSPVSPIQGPDAK